MLTPEKVAASYRPELGRSSRPGAAVGDEAIEQVVLRLLELGDLGQKGASVPVHHLGVALGLAMLPVGKRSLRNERTQSGLVGLVGEVRELFVGDRELPTQLHQPFGHISQPLFEQRAGHPGSLGPARGSGFATSTVFGQG